MAVPKLNPNHFETLNRGILECGGNVRSCQDELKSVMDDLAKNEEDYHKGRLPRGSYRNNSRKFTRERRRLEREINDNVRNSLALITRANRMVRAQRV